MRIGSLSDLIDRTFHFYLVGYVCILLRDLRLVQALLRIQHIYIGEKLTAFRGEGHRILRKLGRPAAV